MAGLQLQKQVLLAGNSLLSTRFPWCTLSELPYCQPGNWSWGVELFGSLWEFYLSVLQRYFFEEGNSMWSFHHADRCSSLCVAGG
jgi:hypothetical protein